jgi:dTDP-glucose 4,6-dehydratase
MKILVTGGAGFIGSNFILYMFNKYPDYKIINLDALTYAGNLSNLKFETTKDFNYKFYRGRIENKRDVVFAADGVDAVINFAAESHVDNSIANSEPFLETNILGTANLLNYARDNNIKKFIQVSTDEVYGSLGEQGFFSESSLIKPNSPYSATKAAADHLVHAYHETWGLNTNITRCSNNYGPRQHKEKLIPKTIDNIINLTRVPVYGAGTNIRDWLHVEDHCSAIDLVLHGGKPGEVYNVGGNNELTNIDVVKKILGYLKKDESYIEYVKDRLGHDFRYAIDATKIKNDLGWSPKYDFEEGIKQTIEWYVK